jgi:competence protein ComEC
MYALQLSSFAVLSDHLNTVFVAVGILLLVRQWVVLIWFTIGVLLFYHSAQQLIDTRIAPNIAGDSIVAQLRISDFPASNDSSINFLAYPLNDERLPDKIRLSWFEPPVVPHLGETWELEIRLRRPRGNRNPGGFDYEAWLFREQVAATGYVVNGRRNQLLGRDDFDGTQRIRARFVERVTKLLGESEQASVLLAVVVGARHKITAEQWDRYAATGSSHLMAISGLHIGLAAIGAYFVTRLLSGILIWRGECRNHHLLAVVVALLLAATYASISGFAIPARRAVLMLALASVCLLRMRRPDTGAIVSMTCLILAMTNPLASMAPGFILSFAAVATLVWLSRRRRVGLPSMQLSLLLALMPLTAILFGRVSLAALPVNLIAVPLFSLVTVPFALAGLILDGPLQLVGDWALFVAGGSIRLLEAMLQRVSDQPWASILLPPVTGISWLYIWLPVAWALLPGGWPGRSLAWIGLAGIALYTPKSPAPDCALISVLDVGQGLAVVIQTYRRAILYDTGPAYRGGGDAVSSIVLPYLRSRGIREIDRMIVSHADLDHAGGVASMTDNLPVRQILSGEALPDIHSRPCRAGHAWSYDGIRFTVLHPSAKTRLTGNDSSCVVLVEAGSYRVLLSGDVEKAAEHEMLQKSRLRMVHVATVPHHGSRTSSTAPFVNALRPSIAIVSASYGNHWGFPKKDVVARWRSAGATVLNTATDGTIEMRVCAASGFEPITRYRHLNRRIWHE